MAQTCTVSSPSALYPPDQRSIPGPYTSRSRSVELVPSSSKRQAPSLGGTNLKASLISLADTAPDWTEVGAMSTGALSATVISTLEPGAPFTSTKNQ